MARPTVSGQEASNKRERVIAAAVSSFASRGVAGTSMRRIAEAVGITDATLYHYFPSKRALLEAAFRSASYQTDDLQAALEGPGPLRDRLHAAGHAFLDVLAGDPEWTRLIIREGLKGSDEADDFAVGTLLARLGGQRIEALAALLRREVATGRARSCDEELVAAHFFHACVGFWIGEAMIAKAPPGPARRKAFLDHLVDLLGSRLAPAGTAGVDT